MRDADGIACRFHGLSHPMQLPSALILHVLNRKEVWGKESGGSLGISKWHSSQPRNPSCEAPRGAGPATALVQKLVADLTCWLDAGNGTDAFSTFKTTCNLHNICHLMQVRPRYADEMRMRDGKERLGAWQGEHTLTWATVSTACPTRTGMGSNCSCSSRVSSMRGRMAGARQ